MHPSEARQGLVGSQAAPRVRGTVQIWLLLQTRPAPQAPMKQAAPAVGGRMQWPHAAPAVKSQRSVAHWKPLPHAVPSGSAPLARQAGGKFPSSQSSHDIAANALAQPWKGDGGNLTPGASYSMQLTCTRLA